MPRNCVNSADNFCYICGEVMFARQRKAITATVKRNIICISDARSATKTNSLAAQVAVNVQQIFRSGWMAKDM
jgi:hypothetical protein